MTYERKCYEAELKINFLLCTALPHNPEKALSIIFIKNWKLVSNSVDIHTPYITPMKILSK